MRSRLKIPPAFHFRQATRNVFGRSKQSIQAVAELAATVLQDLKALALRKQTMCYIDDRKTQHSLLSYATADRWT